MFKDVCDGEHIDALGITHSGKEYAQNIKTQNIKRLYKKNRQLARLLQSQKPEAKNNGNVHTSYDPTVIF